MPFGLMSWLMASVVPHRQYGIVDLYTWDNLSVYGRVKGAVISGLPIIKNNLSIAEFTSRRVLVIYWLLLAILLVKFHSFFGFARLFVITLGVGIIYAYLSILFPVQSIRYCVCKASINSDYQLRVKLCDRHQWQSVVGGTINKETKESMSLGSGGTASTIHVFQLTIAYLYHPILSIAVAPIIITIRGQYPSSDHTICKLDPCMRVITNAVLLLCVQCMIYVIGSKSKD